MILEQYKPSDRDQWMWLPAELHDIQPMLEMSRQFYFEAEDIFQMDLDKAAHHLAVLIFDQKYDLLKQQVIVAKDSTGRVLAYAVMSRDKYVPYSRDEIAEAQIAHIDQSLSTRIRVTLMAQIIQQWELWARLCNVRVICSNTMRGDQKTFLKLHEHAGYSVRGSVAFKRIGL